MWTSSFVLGQQVVLAWDLLVPQSPLTGHQSAHVSWTPAAQIKGCWPYLTILAISKTTDILARGGVPSWIFALVFYKWVPSIFPCMACLSETLALHSLGLWCFNTASFGLNSASFGFSCSLWEPFSVFTNSYGKPSPGMFYTLKWKHLIKTAIWWSLLKGLSWLTKHMGPENS